MAVDRDAARADRPVRLFCTALMTARDVMVKAGEILEVWNAIVLRPFAMTKLHDMCHPYLSRK